MRRWWWAFALSGIFAFELGSVAAGGENPGDSAAEVIAKTTASGRVSRALVVLDSMLKASPYRDLLTKALRRSYALLIFPSTWKAGVFVFGAGGGRGLLLVKAPDGKWSYPTFWSLFGLDVGLKFGFQTGAMIVVFERGRSVGKALKGRFLWNAFIRGSIGPRGAGLGRFAVFPPPAGHIVSFVRGGGFYVGFDLGTSWIHEDLALDRAYYGQRDASTKRVILDGNYANSQADPLRALLSRYSR